MLLVLGGPFIVVIAATVTGVIAWQGEDKVVSRDYYKQGLNINQDIIKDAKAREYKITAKAKFDPVSALVSVQLEGDTAFQNSILFTISTSSAASTFEQTQKIQLQQVKPGIYEGKLIISSIPKTVWHAQVNGADWRVSADWINPAQTSLELKYLN